MYLPKRTEKEIERSITHLDIEHEMWRLSRRHFVRDRGRVLMVPDVRGGMGAITNKWLEPIYESPSAGTAKNTFTVEFQLNDTAGMGPVAYIPAYYFTPGSSRGKQLRIV